MLRSSTLQEGRNLSPIEKDATADFTEIKLDADSRKRMKRAASATWATKITFCVRGQPRLVHKRGVRWNTGVLLQKGSQNGATQPKTGALAAFMAA